MDRTLLDHCSERKVPLSNTNHHATTSISGEEQDKDQTNMVLKKKSFVAKQEEHHIAGAALAPDLPDLNLGGAINSKTTSGA
jgi:hypothetical protein